MHRSVLTLSLGLAAAVLAPRPSAKACEETCEPPLRLFPTGSEVPGDLVYFKVRDESFAPFTLRTAAGAPIAASIRTIGSDKVFAPDEPIPAGTSVVVEYDWKCRGAPVHTADEFTTIEATEVEQRAPDLAVLRRGLENAIAGRETPFVDFEYYNTDARGSLYHLIDVTATIDGMPTRLDYSGDRPMLHVASLCRPDSDEYGIDSCGDVNDVPPGTHTVEVKSTIVGLTAPAPVQRTIELSCTDACMPATVDHAEQPLGQDPTAEDSSGDTGWVDGPGRKHEASGCSLGRHGAPGAGWLALVAARLLVRRRRSRTA
jgi:hypothetical protein